MYGDYSIVDEIHHWVDLQADGSFSVVLPEAPLHQIARKGLAEYARNKPTSTPTRRPGGTT